MTIAKLSLLNQKSDRVLKKKCIMKTQQTSAKIVTNKRLLSLIMALAMGKLAIMLALSYYFFL